MKPNDLQIDTFTIGGSFPVRVRVTHLPTGRVAEAKDLSLLKARRKALSDLRELRGP